MLGKGALVRTFCGSVYYLLKERLLALNIFLVKALLRDSLVHGLSVWGSHKTSLVVLDTRFDSFTLVLPAPDRAADGMKTLSIKHHSGLAKLFSGPQSCWNAFIAYSRGSGLQLKKRDI